MYQVVNKRHLPLILQWAAQATGGGIRAPALYVLSQLRAPRNTGQLTYQNRLLNRGAPVSYIIPINEKFDHLKGFAIAFLLTAYSSILCLQESNCSSRPGVVAFSQGNGDSISLFRHRIRNRSYLHDPYHTIIDPGLPRRLLPSAFHSLFSCLKRQAIPDGTRGLRT